MINKIIYFFKHQIKINLFYYIIVFLSSFFLLLLVIKNFTILDTFKTILIFVLSIFFTWMSFLPPTSYFIWFKRIIIYFMFGLVSFILSIIILSNFGNIHETNIDNARYMLSALIQSEAAIVAIVITLTLVVVQQASASYSTRVIDVFKTRNPDFWILLFIYIVSIIYGLSVLKNLAELNSTTTISNLGNQIFYAFSFGFFALLALVPYMWNTIDLLRPAKIIQFLSENITNQNLVNSIFGDSDNKEDPIQPIIDIINSSLMKYDHDIVREGLKIIVDKIEYILINNGSPNDIIKKVITDFERVGKIASDREDKTSVIEVIKSIEKIGIIMTKQNFDSNSLFVLQDLVFSLKKLGEISASKKLDTSSYIVSSLLNIKRAKNRTEAYRDENHDYADVILIIIKDLLIEAKVHGFSETVETIKFDLL